MSGTNNNKVYQQVHVEIIDVTPVYPAWIDEVTHWNGWEVPLFDREVIKQMEEESSPDMRVFLDGNEVVVVLDGDARIPDSVTTDMLKEAVSGMDKDARELQLGDIVVELSRHQPREVFDGEKNRTVYPVGSGLTWNRSEPPSLKM